MTINISWIILNLFDLSFQFLDQYVSNNWTLDNMPWDPTDFDEFLSDMEKEKKLWCYLSYSVFINIDICM